MTKVILGFIWSFQLTDEHVTFLYLSETQMKPSTGATTMAQYPKNVHHVPAILNLNSGQIII